MSKPQIFLSYAKQDREKVTELYGKLRDVGYQPWLDYLDIRPGETWKDSIRRAIQKSNFFLACLSHSSVVKGGYLQSEIKYALELKNEKLPTDIFLIPVKLEEVEMPEQLADIQWVEYFKQ